MWIWVTAASLLVFGTVGTAAAVPATRGKRADQRLNVVLILSDDERFGRNRGDEERPDAARATTGSASRTRT